MICNGKPLLAAAPILNMEKEKISRGGTTFGLGEAGYDIRIKQGVVFHKLGGGHIQHADGTREHFTGRFVLASAIEAFDMPTTLVGVVHDKSTWARRGLSVFNTVIEPGWCGFLTLELVYHGDEGLYIPAGAGIAQVLFTQTQAAALYQGRYQNQEDKPTPAKDAT
ncbi:putative deoxycytidine triphosphate deaminase [Achromobacter phage vB_AxyP_19-32_Axy04]|uniref:Putative deoxycytidine triphosphate deaminase n=1 Tax=Achromobacter phage vB_AxyP_19-32_Axy04 TaxID=2591039 RepID=A0A514CTG2_9CAUD|nr:dCTP deaminase [Achromobacter phage vB_AxyP_19-32_Axy04]QDH83762.1 putative deoxycytidine triphosphate deaminase [Achromobacter phage vB_AxyP_19-32_Axy04]